MRLSPGTDRIVDSSDDCFGQLLLPFNFSLIDISKAAFDNGDSFVRWSNVEARAMNLDLSTGDYTVEWWGARAFPTTPELVVTSSGSVANLRRIETTRYDDMIKGSDFSITLASGIQRGEEFLNSGGSDVIDGRGGVDLVGVGSVAFDKRVSNLVVDLEKGTMKNIDGAISTLRNIEGARLTFDNDDVFTGDDKDNIVYPNGGANTLDGKGGVDTLEYSIQGGNLGGITVRLQDGEIVNPSGDIDKVVNFEIVRGTPTADTMQGDDVDNSFYGNDGDDILRGGAGNDVLIGVGGDDSLFGEDGDDTLVGSSGVDAFDGGADSDTIDFSQEFVTLGVNVRLKNGDVLDTYGNAEKAVGIENLIGTDRRDILNGDNEDNVIEGGGDRDTIGGLDGDDVLKGGAKKDNIGGGKGNDEIEGGGGNDTIFGGADRDLIKGGGGKDTIFGEAGADTIDGGGGKDQIKDDKMEVESAVLMDDIRDEWDNNGRFSGVFDARANVLVGGAGNDSIFGIRVLDGGRGNDELTGFGFMIGGAGNDTLIEDASLSGGPVSNRRSPDTIMSGGDGNDRMVGGDLDYSYAQSGVRVNMNNGTAIVSARDKDTFEDVNGLFLTEFADIVKTGLSENQFFELGGGNDTVDANVTLDRLDGRVFINAEDGDDVIRSTGDSEIVVRGGQGSDTVDVKGTEQKVAVLGGAQNDTITVDTKGAVDITGDAGKDTITVSAGIGPRITERSLISGGGQNDTITLSNVNNARVNGGTGKDTFIIEFVSQVNLNGGNSADVFIIRAGSVLIEDFGRGKDVLDLRQAKGLTSTTFTELLGSSVDGFDGLDITVGSYTVTLDGLTKADLTSDMVLI